MKKTLLSFFLLNSCAVVTYASHQPPESTGYSVSDSSPKYQEAVEKFLNAKNQLIHEEGHAELVRIFHENESEKYDAAYWLWTIGNSTDKETVRSFLLDIAKSMRSKNHEEASVLLWEKGTSDDKQTIKPILLERSIDKAGWNVILHLKDNRDILRELVQTEGHYRQYYAAAALFNSSIQIQDKDLASRVATPGLLPGQPSRNRTCNFHRIRLGH